MTDTQATVPAAESGGDRIRSGLYLLWRDKFAFAAMLFLVLVALAAIFGPLLAWREATAINLQLRNVAPFNLDHGWLNILGTDALGRSILARIIVGSQNTIAISAAAVVLGMIVGGVLGLIAGFQQGWVGGLIMRLADVVMSFPPLLIAIVVLYVLQPAVINIVMVLAITRIPLYLRVTRAEVLEIRTRDFVLASRLMGAPKRHQIIQHVLPMVLPGLLTVATMDFAYVMLAEAALSFLGLGIQPPDITWGMMVSEGRNYLAAAWWLTFWPGLAIMLTALAVTLVASWMRVVNDPQQRWRLEIGGRIG